MGSFGGQDQQEDESSSLSHNSFIQSPLGTLFTQEIHSISVPGAKDTVVNKTKIAPLQSSIILRETKEGHQNKRKDIIFEKVSAMEK